jgi:hypothetical protein
MPGYKSASVGTRSVGGDRLLRWFMRRLATMLRRRSTTAAAIGATTTIRARATMIEVAPNIMTTVIVDTDRELHRYATQTPRDPFLIKQYCDLAGGEIALTACAPK